MGIGTRNRRRGAWAPQVELLEDRTQPATLGVPWHDPRHLTLSFAPDGTTLGAGTSSLFRTLARVGSPTAWQREVLRAFQTWAVQANLNVGMTGDAGAPFGTRGRTQGDGRVGDIRIGALPLSPDVLSSSVPP